MAYLVSPSEKNPGKGIKSPLPEKFGVDWMIVAKASTGGIQRKQFPEDFFASVTDGRLTREIGLMKKLDFRILVLEGRVYYTDDGHLLSPNYSSWTKQQLRNLIRSLKFNHDIHTEWTDSVEDTITVVEELLYWMTKTTHKSLLTRSKSNMKGEWGKEDKREWARFFLQGFPGVGATLAENIYDACGRVPLSWDVEVEDMVAGIPRMGRKTAEHLHDLLR